MHYILHNLKSKLVFSFQHAVLKTGMQYVVHDAQFLEKGKLVFNFKHAVLKTSMQYILQYFQ